MALVAADVGFRYDAGGPWVLEAVSLRVEPGTVVGLRGPSGAGKTTLTRILTGLRMPGSGRVTVDGVAVATRRGRMDGRVGLVHQSPRTATDPRRRLERIITEPIRHGAGRAGRAGSADRTDRVTAAALARRAGLTEDLLDRLPGQVSEGQLQRACLARSLAAAPDYLICDEPTAMLDAAATATIAHLLRGLAAAGTGVLVVSHDRLLLGAFADRVLELDELERTGRPAAEPGTA
ncbi:ATP-binding cassette domain-containing protein [Pseudactinotalea sp. HY160]|nr:ATP-binding cassette domain-containing protein [Pseudactinotalea sp. HY160]MPV49692.1 ATP-binding cassette domain-containing protein [Pseudactinotalea sp. HY160]